MCGQKIEKIGLRKITSGISFAKKLFLLFGVLSRGTEASLKFRIFYEQEGYV